MANVFDKAQAEQMPEGMEQDDGMGEDNPEYMQARELMLSKLYEEGAAEGIAQALQSAQSPVEGIVDQSMSLADAMEQATQGSVPDELVMMFVIDIVQEVVEIAQAAGMQVADRDIAEAIREVLAQVIENLGGDSSQIREEMGQMDPEQVGAAARQAVEAQ
jgi:hypothetical protein